MKRILAFIIISFGFYTISTTSVKAVNPIIAIEGNADTNKDRKITNGELIAYMDQNVSIKASELGMQQNPSLTGDPNKILLRY